MKTAKRSLAVFLAALMMLGSLTAFAVLFDGTTLKSEVRFYRQVGSDWVETTEVVPGEIIQARTIYESDFIVGCHDLVYFYNKDLLTLLNDADMTPAVDGEEYPLVPNPAANRGVVNVHYIDTDDASYELYPSTGRVATKPVDAGYIDASAYDTYNLLYVRCYGGLTSVFDGETEVYTFYFKVNENIENEASIVGSMFLPTEFVVKNSEQATYIFNTMCTRAIEEEEIGIPVDDLEGITGDPQTYDLQVVNKVSENIGNAIGATPEEIANNTTFTYGTNPQGSETSSYLTVAAKADVDWVFDEQTITVTDYIGKNLADIEPDISSLTVPFGYSGTGWPKNADGKIVDDAGNLQVVTGGNTITSGNPVTYGFEPRNVTVSFYPPAAFDMEGLAYNGEDGNLSPEAETSWTGPDSATFFDLMFPQEVTATYGEAYAVPEGYSIVPTDSTHYYFAGWVPFDKTAGITMNANMTNYLADLSALTQENATYNNIGIYENNGQLYLDLAPVILLRQDVLDVTWHAVNKPNGDPAFAETVISKDFETSIELNEVPTVDAVEGYTFNWYVDEQHQTQATFPKVVTSNLEYWGFYLPNPHTVTYNIDGTADGQPDNYVYGDTITVRDNPADRPGYTFSGWTFTKAGTEDPVAIVSGTTTMPDYDIVANGQWIANEYIIIYNENYQDCLAEGAEAPDTYLTYGVNTTVPAVTLTLEGHVFGGWFTDDDTFANAYQNTWEFILANATLKAGTDHEYELNVYAKWDLDTFDINYIPGDEATFTGEPKVTYQYQDVIQSVANPEKEGFVFNTWNYTNADSGEAVEVTPGTTKMPAFDINAAATWTPEQYIIRYFYKADPTDPGCEFTQYGEDQAITFGDEIELVDVPVFAGFDITWVSDDAALTGTMGDIGENGAIIKVYAQYDFASLSIYYFDGSFAVGEEYEVMEDLNIGMDIELDCTPEDPDDKEGYYFDGWKYYDSVDRENETFGTEYTGEKMPGYDLYAEAQWQIEHYTINFDSKGGNEVASISKDYNEATEYAGNPVKVGYTFAGWYTDEECTDGNEFTVPVNMTDLGADGTAIIVYAKWAPISYTIKYAANADAGISDDVIAYTDGTDAIPTHTPVKAGYTFNGWYLDADFTEGKEYNPTWETVIANAPAENNYTMTVYAKWTANKYTIKYGVNGGNAVENTVLVYNAEQAPEIPEVTPEKEGNSFVDWYLESAAPFTTAYERTWAFIFDNAVQDPDGAENEYILNVYADWTVLNYKIFYDADGGNLNDDAEKEYAFGATINDVADPEMDGNVFSGWVYTNHDFAEHEAVTVTPGTTTMPAYNIDAKATWTPEEYVFTYWYKPGGPSDTDYVKFGEDQTVTFGEDVEFADVPVLAGYYVTWDPVLIIDEFGCPDLGENGEEIKFYAQYEPAPLNIYYIDGNFAEGEEFEIVSDLYIGDVIEDVGLPGDPDDKQGYVFDGWKFYDSIDRENETFGNEYTEAEMPGYDLYAEAQWRANVYTVIYEEEGGDAIADDVLTYGTDTVPVRTTAKTGYGFDKWYIDTQFDTPYTATWDFILAHAALKPGTDNEYELTVYANWIAGQHTITYDANQGTLADGTVNPVTVAFEAVIDSEPDDPSRTGYTFAGWTYTYKDNGVDTEYPVTIGTITMPDNDLVATAQWTPNEYTITYATNGGSEVAPSVLTYPDSVIPTVVSEKDGYTFGGWFIDDTTFANAYATTWDFIIANSEQVSGGNENQYALTVYAKWTANEYTINYITDGSAVAADTLTYGEDNVPAKEDKVTVKEGYVFDDWYLEEGHTTAYTSDWTTVLANAQPKAGGADNEYELNVYANFTKDSFKIYYNNEGDVTEKTYEFEATIEAIDDPVKTGYTFTGWTYTNRDSADHEAVTVVPGTTTMPAFNIDAVAGWKANQYTIIYTTEGTPVDSDVLVYDTDDVPAKTDRVTTWDGHDFDDWYIDAGHNTKYLSTWEFIVANATPAAGGADNEYELNVYAAWQTSQRSITYMLNGAQYGDIEWHTIGEDISLREAPEIPTGYMFTGWSAIPAVMPNENLTVTGRLFAKTVTISYIVNGETYQQDTAVYGDAYTIYTYEDPAGEINVTSWSGVVNGATAAYTPGQEITVDFADNITLTAATEGATYTATFTLGEGKNNGAVWADDTTDDITKTYEVGETLEVPEAIWAGHTYYFDPTPTVMPAENTVFTAIWDAETKVISYPDVEIDLKVGDAINSELPEDPEKPGYTFDGWKYIKDNGDGTTEEYTGATVPPYDLTAEPKWVANKYKIIYNSNGGSAVAPDELTYEVGDVPERVSELAGQTFGGWYLDDGTFANAYSATWEFIAENAVKNGEVYELNVYASWADDPRTVIFNANEGTINGDETLEITKNVTAPFGEVPEPVRTGYTFSGWNTAADGSGDAFAVPANMPDVENGSMTVYAQWTANKYTISYTTDGSAVDDDVLTYGTDDVPADRTTAKDGYTFDDWYLEDTYTTAYTPDWDTVLAGATKVSGGEANEYEMTVYAKFDANVYTIKFSVPDDADPVANDGPLTYGVDTPANDKSTSRPNYTFNGWYLDEECTDGKEYDAAWATVIANATNIRDNQYELTVYAKWTGDTYTIHYNVGASETVIADASFVYGTDEITVTDTIPVLDKNVFDGWYLDAACTDGKEFKDSAVSWETVIANANAEKVLNLHAKYTENAAIVKLVPKTDTDTVVERNGIVETYHTFTQTPRTVTEVRAPFTDSYGYEAINSGVQDAKGFDTWFITGIPQRARRSALDTYFEVTGGGYYKAYDRSGNEITAANTTIGTGVVIKVFDAENNFVEQFYIVIYGDLDGNSALAANDATVMNLESQRQTHWSDTRHADYTPYLVKAADLDQNGRFASNDTNLLKLVNQRQGTIDQVEGRRIV